MRLTHRATIAAGVSAALLCGVTRMLHGQADTFSPGKWISATERHRSLETLEAMRAIWDKQRPSGYIIRVIEISHCIQVDTRPRAKGELRRSRIVVHDTTIVSHEAAPISAFYEQRCLREMRVDDLFADVRRALNDSTAYLRNIQYDAAYGFPRSYWITRGFDLPWGTVVESFATSP